VGANGKSTFQNTLKYVLGDCALQCGADTLMVQKFGSGINNDLARLRGARLVVTSEVEDGKRFAESLVKQLTGGDAIPARFLYSEYFEYSPTFKIWIAANHRPIIRGDDHAIWRRVRLIPFEVIIPPEDRDPTLFKRLCAEGPGILNWFVQGCLEWQRSGLCAPEKVKEATNQYQGDMDLIGQWLFGCCEVDPQGSAPGGQLYQSYKVWMEQNGGSPLSNRNFAQKLTERGYTRTKTRQGAQWSGVRLLSPLPTGV
jgi:putative DNA primase/helicase